MSLNPIKKLVEEKVAEAVAPAVTEVTTKAAEIFYHPAIAQTQPRHSDGSLYFQLGVYEAREGFAPRTVFQNQQEEANYLAGYNAEKEKMRVEAERCNTKDRTFSLAGIFLAGLGIGVGLYAACRMWPKSKTANG